MGGAQGDELKGEWGSMMGQKVFLQRTLRVRLRSGLLNEACKRAETGFGVVRLERKGLDTPIL